MLSIQSKQTSENLHPVHPAETAEVKKLVGVLWYEMLSSLNQSGLDNNALGAGGNNFQSMFLWNIAENDFGHFDDKLVDSTLRQVGGASAQSQINSKPEIDSQNTLPMLKLQSPIFEENLVSTDNDSTLDYGQVEGAENFVKSIWPYIKTAAKTLGVPTIAVLAQTILETGWGTAKPGNNLFGIKAADGQPGSLHETHEVIDGILTSKVASFKDYSAYSSSVSDYVSLIQSLYPQAMNQSSVSGFAQALQAGGYATDQGYAEKIEQISQSPLMEQILEEVRVTGSGNAGVTP